MGRVPDGKHTNESYNDSLVLEVAGERVPAGKRTNESLNDSLESGGGRSVGASRKGHQRVAMTRWRLYGSGARWKAHQRVYNDSLVLEMAGRESKTGQRVAMTRWQLVPKGKRTNESFNDSLVQEKGGRWPGSGCVGRVPKGKCTNESLNDSLV